MCALTDQSLDRRGVFVVMQLQHVCIGRLTGGAQERFVGGGQVFVFRLVEHEVDGRPALTPAGVIVVGRYFDEAVLFQNLARKTANAHL